MKVESSRLKRIGGGILEFVLGAFVVGLLIAALHPRTGATSSAATNPDPASAGAMLQQVPGGTLCIVDDSNGNQLTVEPGTGVYTFTNCTTFTLTGTGLVTIKGCTVTLQHVTSDRRVTATIDFCTKRAKAAAQTFSPRVTMTIVDRDITDDVCGCVTTAGD